MIRSLSTIMNTEEGLRVLAVEAVHTAEARDRVVNSRCRDDLGRSQWLRFTMSDGTVIFGCYPPVDLA